VKSVDLPRMILYINKASVYDLFAVSLSHALQARAAVVLKGQSSLLFLPVVNSRSVEKI
jgi:hypothetical protein